jgi:hypothetical protein
VWPDWLDRYLYFSVVYGFQRVKQSPLICIVFQARLRQQPLPDKTREPLIIFLPSSRRRPGSSKHLHLKDWIPALRFAPAGMTI